MIAAEYKKHIKGLLYAKTYGGVVEESVNHWNADIIGMTWSGEVNEFEIKVSLVDLKGEIKAIKRALLGGIYKNEVNQSGFFGYNRVQVEEKVSLTKLEKHYCYLVGDKQGGMSFTGTPYEESQMKNSRENPQQCFVPYKFYFAVPSFLVESAKELLAGVPYYGIMNADDGTIKKSAKKLPRNNVRTVDMTNLFMRACTEWRQDDYRLRQLEKVEKQSKEGYPIAVWGGKPWEGKLLYNPNNISFRKFGDY